MGRGKQKMELIADEKSRRTTFQKRKKGLMKKAYEFSTLCDVDVCIIIYGPSKQEDEVHTWPTDPNEVKRIVGKYYSITKSKPAYNVVNVFDIMSDRKRRIDADISKLRKAFYAAKYPTWHQSLDYCSNYELDLLLNRMNPNIEALDRLIEFKKLEIQARNINCTATSNSESDTRQQLFEKPSYSFSPFDIRMQQLPFSDMMTSTRFDSHTMTTSTMPFMTMMLGNDFYQGGYDYGYGYGYDGFGDQLNGEEAFGSSFDQYINKTTASRGQSLNDPAAPGMFNNVASFGTSQQYLSMLNYPRYPFLPSSSPQMHGSEFGNTESNYKIDR